MQVDGIDHVNIRTTDIAGTARFFADVLDMTITPNPSSNDPAKGAWLRDAEGRAAIHLSALELLYPWEGETPALGQAGSGRIHHVAMRCSGYPETVARLTEKGLGFHTNELPTVGLRQIFVPEPNGILLELNFFGD